MNCGKIFAGRLVALAGAALGCLCFAAGLGAAIRDGGIDPANLGKGEWIFIMSSATNKLGNNVPGVTNEISLMNYFKSQGVQYIIVKAATSNSLYFGTYSSPQFTTNLCTIARTNGIKIFGYNRSYGADIPGEVAISDYVFNCGADGFVWDAEAEWEIGATHPWITNASAQAWALCSTVRSNWPTKFLAHAPLPIIYGHQTFPYKEFGYWSDGVMPQIYHFNPAFSPGVKRSQSAGINWTDVNWRKWQSDLIGSNTLINGQTIFWTNSIKPLAPINDVYGPLFSPTYADQDVTEFIDYLTADPNGVTAGGYNGVNFFRSELHGTVQWANIKAGTSGSFPNLVNNIVIDDANAAVSGAWTPVRTFAATASSSGSTPTYYGATGSDTNSFGTNYWVKGQGAGADYVRFTPKVVTPGDYYIYQWHPYRADASTNVPFVINYSGGTTTVFANQQTNDGNWSFLGRYAFAAGAAGEIRVTDAIPEAGAVAMADGLKLVFVAPLRFVSIVRLSGQRVQLNWSGDAGASYIVEGSSDLPHWSQLGTAASPNTSFQFTNSPATNQWLFYRVRTP